MMQAEAHSNYGGYVPGGLPDNVKNIRAVGTDKVQMTIIGKFSPSWFTDNELSQISPLPLSVGHAPARTPTSDCADHASDCAAVFNYLNAHVAELVNLGYVPVVEGRRRALAAH